MRAAVAEDAVTGTEMARNEALSRALVDIAHVSRVSLFFPTNLLICVLFLCYFWMFLAITLAHVCYAKYFKNKN